MRGLSVALALIWLTLAGCAGDRPPTMDATVDAGESADARPDAPPIEDDDDVACHLIISSPDRGPDAGAEVERCVPGHTRECACPSGRRGVQSCNTLGRRGPCLCGTAPVVTDTADPDAGIQSYPDAAPRSLPPRLVRPVSGMRVTSQRPTLRWELPSGLSRARVELCADRACMRPLGSAEVSGSSWRSPTALRPGVVFWRVRGLGADGGVAWTSATWEFAVRHRDTPVDSAYGPLKDFNGDGFDDAVVSFDPRRILLLLGTRGGARRTPQPVIAFEAAVVDLYVLAIGDLNGDGLADLGVRVNGNYRYPGGVDDVVLTYLGSRGCPVREAQMIDNPFYGTVISFAQGLGIADFNGDGYGDLIVSSTNRLDLYLGGEGGVERAPHSYAEVLDGTTLGEEGSIQMVGDVDGDGYPDIAVGSNNSARGAGRVQIFYGNPEGRLEARVQILPSRRGVVPSVPGGQFGSTLRAADFNGDGFADLVVGALGAYYHYRGGERGLTFFQQSYANSEPSVGAVGDLDGDGLPELLILQPPRLEVYRARVSGFARAPDVQFGLMSHDRYWGDYIASPGDMDGDGYDDLLIAGTIGGPPDATRIHLFRGGDLAFVTPTVSWVSAQTGVRVIE